MSRHVIDQTSRTRASALPRYLPIEARRSEHLPRLLENLFRRARPRGGARLTRYVIIDRQA